MTIFSTISVWIARRGMLLGLAIFIGYLIVITAMYADGRKAAERGESPMLTDFTSLYAASILLRQQPAADLYRPKEMYQASLLGAQAAYGGNLSEKQARAIGMHPWMYPPTFILAALPLAYLPYFMALLAWLVLTAIPYLAAMREILRDQSVWLIALGAPPVFYNLIYGQTGFLIAGLIALGLVWLRSRPVLAGICIGLASVKPHFGLLIPIALICGAHWRAFWAALATVLGGALLSALLLGADPWYAFIGTLFANMRGFEQGIYKWWVMPSVMGALHQSGLDLAWAGRGQMLAAALALTAVAWAWWQSPGRTELPGLEAAVLCSATLLAVPMVYLYDMMLLVPAIAWLWSDMRLRGYHRIELLLLAGGSAGLLGAIKLGAGGPIYGALLSATLLGLALRRIGLAKRIKTA
jgi:hypothetical protein